MYTIDFETEMIINGAPKMPVPVGVSIKHNDEPSHYYAWGHPTNNNCSKATGIAALSEVYDSDEPIIMHNAKFDLRVANEHLGLPIPFYARIVDTMIMTYLLDAREASLSLKPLTEKYCNLPPVEQKDLEAWIVKHVPGSRGNVGGHISKAPGDLVGKYAESDTDRTYLLYKRFEPLIFVPPNGDFQTVYDAFMREMMLIPIVIDMEQRGVSIHKSIGTVLSKTEAHLDLQEMILSAYGNGEKPGSKAMFNVLRKKGLIDESKIQYTDKGNPKYGKDQIDTLVSDPVLSEALKIRSKLQKVVGTYLKPFAKSYSLYKGKFYPYYNQTRSEGDFGTRTGRFSSNIQQLPKVEGSNNELYGITDDRIPDIRKLIIPGENKILIKRDFCGQEVRVLAHYAEGNILKAYNKDPALDPHKFVGELIIENTGYELGRTPVKCINFLKIYGGGPANLAGMLGISLKKAKEFFAAYDSAFPEPKELIKSVEKLARSGKKIRTWGGRSYDVEVLPDGRKMYYKLVNVLIQGSSADMTKEAMIRYWYHPDRFGSIFMQIHDEIVIETDEVHKDSDMAILRWAMDGIEGWDVPLLSDGKFGKTFGDMEVYCDS